MLEIPQITRRDLGIAGAAVVLAVVFIFRGFNRMAKTPAASIKAVPLTSYAGNEFNPNFSPDGNQTVRT